MKEALCHAFCDGLTIAEVPVGLAVGTPFRRSDGDAIGFYVVGPDANGQYRVEDDGLTIADLEASGADLETATRAEAFRTLLREHGAVYDEAVGTLASKPVPFERVPEASLRFIALLLRLQDLALLTPERVASAFKEEAVRAIREAAEGCATVEEDVPASPVLEEFQPDVVLRAGMRPPVAVFLTMSDLRAADAIMLQMTATYEKRVPCAVVALLERDGSISRKMLQRAANRLTSVTVFEGDRDAAVERIVREATGEGMRPH